LPSLTADIPVQVTRDRGHHRAHLLEAGDDQ